MFWLQAECQTIRRICKLFCHMYLLCIVGFDLWIFQFAKIMHFL